MLNKLILNYLRIKNRNNYNEENPLISIYTPTYNRAKILLDRAIKSILSQTYTNWEYIIVSDGSTDNTKEIVESLHHPKIRFYQIERKTPHHTYNSKKVWQQEGSNAANFALKQVRGKYIARLDDDDIWEPDFLETMVNRIRYIDLEFITSQFDYIKDGKVVIDNGIDINTYLKIKSKHNNLVGAHSTWFYRSYLKFMKYNPNCYKKKWNSVADTDLLERFVKMNIRMWFVWKVLMHQIPRPNETSVGFQAIQDIIEKYTKNTCSLGLSKEFKDFIFNEVKKYDK